jgi:hypothetical protein
MDTTHRLGALSDSTRGVEQILDSFKAVLVDSNLFDPIWRPGRLERGFRSHLNLVKRRSY